jgi:hypothetical protein
MPRKTFVAGEILTASDVNTNLMDQAVMVFADSSARDSAIPSPSEGMIVYLSDTNAVQTYSGSAWVPAVNTASIIDANVTRAKLASGLAAFTAVQTITASNASWPVPSLGSPIVKVTVIGGGGGGGSGPEWGFNGVNGASGGTTTFDAGGAGAPSAAGGSNGLGGHVQQNGKTGLTGLSTRNGGEGATGTRGTQGAAGTGTDGRSGAVTVSYLNLTGISTVNVTIGGGGAGGSAARNGTGGSGGAGQVIFEYVAA